MNEFKFNKGDKVVIVENEALPDYVRLHYGEELTIKRCVKSIEGENFYSVSGIGNWAQEDDLRKV